MLHAGALGGGGEKNPPKETPPLEWLLLITLPAGSFAQAKEIKQWYSLRWLVEEFHKCEKTGCNVEARRLCDTERLEPLIALLSVLAVYLLQPERGVTVRQFWRGIGLLGGHVGRTRDGPVG